jgi:hypothetical protein
MEEDGVKGSEMGKWAGAIKNRIAGCCEESTTYLELCKVAKS